MCVCVSLFVVVKMCMGTSVFACVCVVRGHPLVSFLFMFHSFCMF